MLKINDYAREAVPDDKTVSGWHIGLIYIGVGLALPAFLIAAMIGQNLGFIDGLLATFLAGMILSAIGMATGWIGGSIKLSTYLIIQRSFGRFGAFGLNLVLILTFFGWFGITISMFAQAMASLLPLPFINTVGWSLLGGALMTTTAIFGFKGLEKLSLIAVPLMFLALLWMAVKGLIGEGVPVLLAYEGTKALSFGAVVSLLVGSWMVGAAVVPDLSRYAKSPYDGGLGAMICFLPGFLLLMGLCMVPLLVFGGDNFMALMLQILSPVIAGLIITLAAWSSNDNNLYAASLGLSSLIPSVPKSLITLVAGVIGTGLSIVGILDHFIPFLMFLGIFMPPIAGAYIADFLADLRTDKKIYYGSVTLVNWRYIPLLGWVGGCVVALLTTQQDSGGLSLLSLSGIPALDGLLTAGILTYGLVKSQKTILAKAV